MRLSLSLSLSRRVPVRQTIPVQFVEGLHRRPDRINARPDVLLDDGRSDLERDHILHDHSNDGVDRRGFLKCMAWAGTGVLWSLNAGVLTSRALGQTTDPKSLLAAPGTLNFVQISDSHIGFKKPANTDVAATFRETIARIKQDIATKGITFFLAVDQSKLAADAGIKRLSAAH